MVSIDQFVSGLSTPRIQLHLLWKTGITVNNSSRSFKKYCFLSCLDFLFHCGANVPSSALGKIALLTWKVYWDVSR